MRFPYQIRLILVMAILWAMPASAGPYSSAGDLLLRHDIQVLVDHGVIKGPTTMWPIAWGPILEDIKVTDASDLPPRVSDALIRVRDRGRWETRTHEWTVNAKAGFADNRTRIRSFQNTPRGKFEFGAGVGYTGDRFSMDLAFQAADGNDDDDIRLDDVMLGVVAGNWSISASTQQRWWGPGWDGSLILSNNARPMPALVIDRVFTDAPKLKWMRWLGPYDFNVIFGHMGDDRHVPNAQFFGMRFNFRPLRTLEIGLSRTAQWCGDDRPCDFSTFGDLFLGRDNRGDSGIDPDNEPGNQLAGVDFRWAPMIGGQSFGFYGQFTGEDEAGGFPSRWLGQFGAEWSGYIANRWSTRIYAEFSATSCQFYESSEVFDCAYNHTIYRTGYRYMERSIGHGADNDARIVSVGALAIDQQDSQWRALIRIGDLNRGGAQDLRNTISPTPRELFSVDLSHSRVFPMGVIDVGLGYETVDVTINGDSRSDVRLYAQWRSSY